MIRAPVGAWRSLVAHLHGVQGVPSSNLGAPTIISSPRHEPAISCLCTCRDQGGFSASRAIDELADRGALNLRADCGSSGCRRTGCLLSSTDAGRGETEAHRCDLWADPPVRRHYGFTDAGSCKRQPGMPAAPFSTEPDHQRASPGECLANAYLLGNPKISRASAGVAGSRP